MQMEALTGWASRDEWAYEVGEMTNHPFLKSNYPDYDGMWGWEGNTLIQFILVCADLILSILFRSVPIQLSRCSRPSCIGCSKPTKHISQVPCNPV